MGGVFVLVCLLVGVIGSARGGVVISEVMYNPVVGSGLEFIELFNTDSSGEVDLSGVVIDAVGFTFPANTVIAAQTFVVVAENRQRLMASYTYLGSLASTVTVVGSFGGSLDNDGETISLLRPGPGDVYQRQVLDHGPLTFNDRAPWSPLADGFGPSLEVVCVNEGNADLYNNANNWHASPLPSHADGAVALSGSPGLPSVMRSAVLCAEAADSVLATAVRNARIPRIYFSEIMYHPLKEDKDVDEHEFVEIYNDEKFDVSLAQWRFASRGKKGLDGVRYTFEADAVIPAKGYGVIAKDPVAFSRVYRPEAANLRASRLLFGGWDGELANGGDKLVLLDSNGHVVEFAQYDDDFPWPMLADALGGDPEVLPPSVYVPQLGKQVAFWPCDDGKSDDESGNGHHAVGGGGTVMTDSRYGNGACRSDGTAAFTTGKWSVQGRALSVALWVKPSNGDTGRFVSKARGPSEDDHFFLINSESSGQLRCRLRTRNDGRDTTLTLLSSGADGIVPTDTWSHVAFTYDGMSLKLYRNKVVVAETTLTGQIVEDELWDVTIGAGHNNYDPFVGLLDEIRILEKVLSASDLAQLHDQGTLPTPAPTPNPGVVPTPVSKPRVLEKFKGYLLQRKSWALPANKAWAWRAQFPSPGEADYAPEVFPLPVVVEVYAYPDAARSEDGGSLSRKQKEDTIIYGGDAVRIEAKIEPAVVPLKLVFVEAYVDNVVANSKEMLSPLTLTRTEDAVAEGSFVYTAVMPVQPENTIVRYRIVAETVEGEARIVKAPSDADPRAYLAYFHAPHVHTPTPIYHFFVQKSEWQGVIDSPREGRTINCAGMSECCLNPLWNSRRKGVLVFQRTVADVEFRLQGSRWNRLNGQGFKTSLAELGSSKPNGLKAFSYRFSLPDWSQIASKSTIILNKMRTTCNMFAVPLHFRLHQQAGNMAADVRYVRLHVNGVYLQYMQELDRGDSDVVAKYAERLNEREGCTTQPSERIGDLFKTQGYSRNSGEGPYGRGTFEELPATCGGTWTPEKRYTWVYGRKTHRNARGHEPIFGVIAGLAERKAAIDNGCDGDTKVWLESQFDIQLMINFLVVQNFAADWDSVFHNYFLYRFTKTGKFSFAPWDADALYTVSGRPTCCAGGDASQESLYVGEVVDFHHIKNAIIKCFRPEMNARYVQFSTSIHSIANLNAVLDGIVAEFNRTEVDAAPGLLSGNPASCEADARNFFNKRRAYVVSQLADVSPSALPAPFCPTVDASTYQRTVNSYRAPPGAPQGLHVVRDVTKPGKLTVAWAPPTLFRGGWSALDASAGAGAGNPDVVVDALEYEVQMKVEGEEASSGEESGAAVTPLSSASWTTIATAVGSARSMEHDVGVASVGDAVFRVRALPDGAWSLPAVLSNSGSQSGDGINNNGGTNKVAECLLLTELCRARCSGDTMPVTCECVREKVVVHCVDKDTLGIGEGSGVFPCPENWLNECDAKCDINVVSACHCNLETKMVQHECGDVLVADVERMLREGGQMSVKKTTNDGDDEEGGDTGAAVAIGVFVTLVIVLVVVGLIVFVLVRRHKKEQAERRMTCHQAQVATTTPTTWMDEDVTARGTGRMVGGESNYAEVGTSLLSSDTIATPPPLFASPSPSPPFGTHAVGLTAAPPLAPPILNGGYSGGDSSRELRSFTAAGASIPAPLARSRAPTGNNGVEGEVGFGYGGSSTRSLTASTMSGGRRALPPPPPVFAVENGNTITPTPPFSRGNTLGGNIGARARNGTGLGGGGGVPPRLPRPLPPLGATTTTRALPSSPPMAELSRQASNTPPPWM